MLWKRKAESSEHSEQSFAPLKTTIIARHKHTNWMVLCGSIQADLASTAATKPIVWGECTNTTEARADAELALSVINSVRTGMRDPSSPLFWPESTTGLVYKNKGTNKLLIPSTTNAQRAFEPWGLRPYYEGSGGSGHLLLITADWAPSAIIDDQGEDSAAIWMGAVRSPLAANEMALSLAELFTYIARYNPSGRSPIDGKKSSSLSSRLVAHLSN